MLLRRDIVVARMLNGDRVTTIAAKPARLLAGVCINFDEIAASHKRLFVVVGHHLRYRNTVRIDRDLVAKLIATLVLAIHNDINGLSPRRIW